MFLEEKYLGKYDDVFDGVLDKFFSYMRKVWIDSTEFCWYEEHIHGILVIIRVLRERIWP